MVVRDLQRSGMKRSRIESPGGGVFYFSLRIRQLLFPWIKRIQRTSCSKLLRGLLRVFVCKKSRFSGSSTYFLLIWLVTCKSAGHFLEALCDARAQIFRVAVRGVKEGSVWKRHKNVAKNWGPATKNHTTTPTKKQTQKKTHEKIPYGWGVAVFFFTQPLRKIIPSSIEKT